MASISACHADDPGSIPGLGGLIVGTRENPNGLAGHRLNHSATLPVLDRVLPQADGAYFWATNQSVVYVAVCVSRRQTQPFKHDHAAWLDLSAHLA